MKISSLRFEGCANPKINSTWRYKNLTTIEFAGFSNAVMEHLFAIPRVERGTVDYVVFSKETETESGILDRIAQVNVYYLVENVRKPYFFYIFAEAKLGALHEWKITGQSILMEGGIRMPDFDKEMIWLE